MPAASSNEIRPAYVCRREFFDGNEDDPNYYYCGMTKGHAGKCGEFYG